MSLWSGVGDGSRVRPGPKRPRSTPNVTKRGVDQRLSRSGRVDINVSLDFEDTGRYCSRASKVGLLEWDVGHPRVSEPCTVRHPRGGKKESTPPPVPRDRQPIRV